MAEESQLNFPPQNFFKGICMALLVGAGFYVLAVGAVSYIAPWRGLLGERFATAVAFEQASHSVWLVRLILGITLVALFQVFNGNFVAASRLVFALGRRGTILAPFGEIHARHQTPISAILGVTLGTLIGLSLGDAVLVPITEVGSMASALGWLAACISFFLVEKTARLRMIAGLGTLAALAFLLMKLLPFVPGHFSVVEWIAFAGWLFLGLLLRGKGKVST